MSRMKLRVAIPVLVIGLFRAAVVQAHVAKKQLVAVRADFKAPQDSYNKLSDEQRKMLAGDALTLSDLLVRPAQRSAQFPYSTDAGATFRNVRLTRQNFPPIHGTNDLVN